MSDIEGVGYGRDQWSDTPPTPSSGVTEGKAESGAVEALQVWAARNQDKFAFSGGRFEATLTEDELLAFAEFVLSAAPQPPAPADDAAEVLAGLREEMDVLIGEYSHDGSWRLARGVERARDMVEAAQRRLADRGQGGGSDG